MKRLVAAVLIIVMSVVFSVWCSVKVDATLEEIAFAVRDDSKKGNELWQEKKEFLSLLLKHEDIDSIDEEMYSMMKLLSADREDDAEDCRIRIEGYIESIRQGEKLSWGNVF